VISNGMITDTALERISAAADRN